MTRARAQSEEIVSPSQRVDGLIVWIWPTAQLNAKCPLNVVSLAQSADVPAVAGNGSLDPKRSFAFRSTRSDSGRIQSVFFRVKARSKPTPLGERRPEGIVSSGIVQQLLYQRRSSMRSREMAHPFASRYAGAPGDATLCHRSEASEGLGRNLLSLFSPLRTAHPHAPGLPIAPR